MGGEKQITNCQKWDQFRSQALIAVDGCHCDKCQMVRKEMGVGCGCDKCKRMNARKFGPTEHK